MKTKSGKTIPPGRIHAVSVSDRKGVVKHNVDEARLVVEHGLAGDAHAEGGIRQVSLLALDSIDKMVAAGAMVAPGDFAEIPTMYDHERRIGEKAAHETDHRLPDCPNL